MTSVNSFLINFITRIIYVSYCLIKNKNRPAHTQCISHTVHCMASFLPYGKQYQQHHYILERTITILSHRGLVSVYVWIVLLYCIIFLHISFTCLHVVYTAEKEAMKINMRYCLMEKENVFLKNPQVKSWTVYPSLGDGYILNRSSADHTAKFGYCCCGDWLAVFRKGIYFSDITRERAAMGKLGRVLLKIFKDTQMVAEHLVSTPFRWSVITCVSIPGNTLHITSSLFSGCF